jgi:predicted sulfurtransferase
MILTEEGFYVCHNAGSIIQYFDLSTGGKLYNGQQFVERFDTKDEVAQRINELANDEKYFDEHFEIKSPETPNN